MPLRLSPCASTLTREKIVDAKQFVSQVRTYYPIHAQPRTANDQRRNAQNPTNLWVRSWIIPGGKSKVLAPEKNSDLLSLSTSP